MAKGNEVEAAFRAAQRSFAKIDRSGGPDACWEWTGQRLPKGYGQIFVRASGGRSWLAHRLAWIDANGSAIPEGLFVLHRCDNPSCCNPRHLFLGTPQDNVDDMHRKGRAGKTGPKPRTHCSKCGLPYARRRPCGQAVCPPCEHLANKRAWARHVERRQAA